MKNKKEIVILGGGLTQTDAIQSAVNLNTNIIVIDGSPNPYFLKKFPKLIFINMNFLYPDPVINELDRLNIKPDVVVAYGSDLSVVPQAIIASYYKIKSIPIEAAYNCRDKDRMMLKWKEAGLNVPDFAICNKESNIFYEASKIGFPLVVKPTSSAAQRGISLVKNKNELLPAVKEAFKFGEQILFSQYIEGDEFAVTTYNDGASCKTILITERLTLPPPNLGICHAHLFPPRISPQLIEKVKETLVKASIVLGVTLGPTYSQIKIWNNKIYLLEMGARFGGGRDSELYKILTGIDNIEMQIRMLLGEKNTGNNLIFPSVSKSGIVKFIMGKQGIFQRLPGEELIKSKSISYNLFYEPGQFIPPLNSASGRLGYFILTGNNPDELVSNAEQLSNLLEIEVK